MAKMTRPIIVNYSQEAQNFVPWLFGRVVSNHELGWLAGALDGATVQVSVQQQKRWLFLEVKDPARFDSYQTSIRPDTTGGLYAYIHDVHAKPSQQKQGWGLRAFQRQVTAAQWLGLKRMELFAAGHPGDRSDIGYYVWARYGFNAPLRLPELKILPADLRGAVNVNDVIQRGGQRWWWDKGSFRAMVFELQPNSAMMKIFRDYLKEKNLMEE